MLGYPNVVTRSQRIRHHEALRAKLHRSLLDAEKDLFDHLVGVVLRQGCLLAFQLDALTKLRGAQNVGTISQKLENLSDHLVLGVGCTIRTGMAD